jgi:response regulator of citrate/malate metabolism
MPEEEMPKSAVKVSQKPKRIAKYKDNFSQNESHDYVQQTEVDMMMPKPEAKEAPKSANSTKLTNITKEANTTK